MKITITDVTRMKGANICVAGLAGDRAIRLSDPTPTEGTIDRLSGLKPSDVVDVVWSPSGHPSPPHLEDGAWERNKIRKIESLSYAEFLRTLRQRSYERITDAFGEIYRKGSSGNFAFRPGIGARSLASVMVTDVNAYLDYDGKPRVSFADAERQWRHVALEDLSVRLHPRVCVACKRNYASMLAREFDTAAAVLRVGLSRPFQVQQHPLACWVQVNGAYPLDRDLHHFI